MTTVPVNEINKTRIEEAVTEYEKREGFGDNDRKASFDVFRNLGVCYTEVDFFVEGDCDDPTFTDIPMQVDITEKDGIYYWHAYTDGEILCGYYEPLEDGEIEALADGSYDWDSLYSWFLDKLSDLVEAGLYTLEED